MTSVYKKHIEHSPSSFIVYAFSLLENELLTRNPDDRPIVQLLKEPLIASGLLILASPTVVAYWVERAIVELVRTANFTTKGTIDELLRIPQKQNNS